MLTALLEKTRQELDVTIAKLQQQLDNVTQQSLRNDQELKLALQNEKQAHDADVDRLIADKVITATVTV